MSSRSSVPERIVSSMRLRNSGRNVWRRTSSIRARSRFSRSPVCSRIRLEAMLDVMITIEFRKSTVRPLPSVSRPFVEDLEEHVENLAWAFSIS